MSRRVIVLSAWLVSISLIFMLSVPSATTLWYEVLKLHGTVQTGTWNGQGGTTLEAVKTVQTVYDEANMTYSVTGEVCISNFGEQATVGLAILDEVQVRSKSDYEMVTQAAISVEVHPVLASGETYCYPYTIPFTPVRNAKQYRNVAHVTVTNHSGWLPGGQNCPGPATCPFGPNPKADFNLNVNHGDEKQEGMPLDPPPPTAEPTLAPALPPADSPDTEPTPIPTEAPVVAPTVEPTSEPTAAPEEPPQP